MKKILVTGGSGKAGKATINKLLEKNYDDIADDCNSSLIILRSCVLVIFIIYPQKRRHAFSLSASPEPLPCFSVRAHQAF